MKKILFLLLIPFLGIVELSAQCNTYITSTNATCFGLTNGTATVNPYGGTAPYTYAWNTIPVQTTQSIFNLPAGQYTVTITDATNCITTANITITQPPPLLLNLNSFNACDSCNGFAYSSVSGGTNPFSYLWSNGVGSASTTNLCAGDYFLSVTDANGCSVTNNFTIINLPGFVVNVTTITEPSGCCNGMASAMVTGGGSAPFTYTWSNGTTTANPGYLCPGWYAVTVTDSQGCFVSDNVNLGGTSTFQIVVDTLSNINCLNNSSGIISVHGTGGSGTYTYSWSGMGITSALPTLHTNIPGNYYVQVSDDNGCSDWAYFTITNTYNLYASISASNANCADNGSAIVSAEGAHPPFTYLWSDLLNQTNDTITNLAAGNYFVTVTDANGCTISGNANINFACVNIVKGRVYNDINQNCIQDPGEPGIAGRAIQAEPNYYYTYTDSLGDYKIETNSNSVVVHSTNYTQPYLTPTCPLSGETTVNFTNLGDTVIANFAYYGNPNYFDLDIHPGWTSANPGFEKTYWFLYASFSENQINATVRFEYDSILQYNSCTQNGVHFPAQHLIVWTFNNLAPGYYWDWDNRPMAYFTVPATASITDSLHAYFEILPIAGDSYPDNNVLDITEPITGSHDPNSKSVIPRGIGSEGFIMQSDSILFYTIHFQNDGNDTAFTVVIKDTLSPFVDPSTIIPGASSHPYTFEMSGQGIITFRFNHIMLPDSNVNEPASNGYVNYTVRQKQNNSIGTVINNTAYIYFDFNEAVITNTVTNTIASPVYIKEYNRNLIAVDVYPNPFTANTKFSIHAKNTDQKFTLQVFDLLGKIIFTKENLSVEPYYLATEGLEKGIYFYKVSCEQQIFASGKLIKE